MARTSLSENEAIVYRMIRKAAEMGDPCPSNSLLTTACGFSSIAAPVGVVNRLKKRGLFKVDIRQRSRVVTFPDGLATKDEGNDIIHHRRPKARARQVQSIKDGIADHLANGATVAAAARAIGVTESRGYRALDEIRADIGWQAV